MQAKIAGLVPASKTVNEVAKTKQICNGENFRAKLCGIYNIPFREIHSTRVRRMAGRSKNDVRISRGMAVDVVCRRKSEGTGQHWALH